MRSAAGAGVDPDQQGGRPRAEQWRTRSRPLHAAMTEDTIARASAVATPPEALPVAADPARYGYYNDKVVRQFAVATIVWGLVGMAVGVLIAAQLYWPTIGEGIPWLGYGRLRPLHTNAVIFAFGGSALFATSLHVVQRTCHVRLISDRLAAFTFWGWQTVIVAAVITLPLGYTSSKEYAELEWPI